MTKLIVKSEESSYVAHGRKLTQEEFELVVDAHIQGLLMRHGSMDRMGEFTDTTCEGCINQVLYNISGIATAADYNQAVATWFDGHYMKYWTVEELMESADKYGIVE